MPNSNSMMDMMSEPSRRILLGAAMATILVCAGGQCAEAEEKRAVPPPITRTSMQFRPIEGTDLEMHLDLIVLQPGVSAPEHHHTVGGLNYIISGTAESAYGDKPVETFKAGQSLQDLPTITHRVFRNPDANSELRFVIFYTVKTGQPYTVFH
jgi:quercetin dioxygenase-like cupin family protein